MPDHGSSPSRVIISLLLPWVLTMAMAQPEHAFTDVFYPAMKSGVACYRIPALVILPNGAMLAAADERVPSCQDLRSNRDINIVLRKSMDKGRTWSPMETIVDPPSGKSASDPSFIYDRITGELFLFYNYMDLDSARGMYRFHLVSSRDGGISWSAPVDITSMITRSGWEDRFRFITSGNGIQTSAGRLLHTIVDVEYGSVRLFGSTDHGRTWELTGEPVTPADETRVVELPDGRWLLNARVNKAGCRYVHLTADCGKTWSTQKESLLPDPGCNAGLIFADVGRGQGFLAFTNPASHLERKKLMLKVSLDGGVTWPFEQPIYAGPSAYSSLAVEPDGGLGILFERENQPVISISMVRKRKWKGRRKKSGL